MLRKIIDLFKERKIISLSNLAIHFKTDESAMEAMLQELVRKGYIQKLHTECNSCSASCMGCSFASEKDFYQLR
ncbi:MAG: LuxR family transcriptional regulator [Candidatus Cloacimonetes bacterium]|nr:LuxR family transcriptional regulator [Candidatus Cloacimonadota bacterium]MBL7148707.1 LuxR family transcriptional regulator [Candidatus Cloacimonadota bacterium]